MLWLCCFWHFLSVFDPLTAFATWCPFFRSEAHVSELSFSDQDIAQLFSCRVKVFVQLSVLRTIFLRVSTYFPRQGSAVFLPCEGQRVVTCRAQAWLERSHPQTRHPSSTGGVFFGKYLAKLNRSHVCICGLHLWLQGSLFNKVPKRGCNEFATCGCKVVLELRFSWCARIGWWKEVTERRPSPECKKRD